LFVVQADLLDAFNVLLLVSHFVYDRVPRSYHVFDPELRIELAIATDELHRFIAHHYYLTW